MIVRASGFSSGSDRVPQNSLVDTTPWTLNTGLAGATERAAEVIAPEVVDALGASTTFCGPRVATTFLPGDELAGHAAAKGWTTKDVARIRALLAAKWAAL